VRLQAFREDDQYRPRSTNAENRAAFVGLAGGPATIRRDPRASSKFDEIEAFFAAWA
jgi:hypothetical protein